MGATQDPSLKGHITRDTEGLQFIWTVMADVEGAPPELRDDTVRVLAFTRETRSACRSLDDVVAVELVPATEQGAEVVIVADPEGEAMGNGAEPAGELAWTAFAVATP